MRAIASLAAIAALALLQHHAAAKPKKKPAKTAQEKKKKADAAKPPPPKDPPPEGQQVDFDYDGKDAGHPERAWWGRAFVPKSAASLKTPLPVFVFLHGTNNDAIKYRWIGAGNEGDIRKMVVDLIEAGKVPPMIIAAPSQIKPESTVNAVTSWPSFDLDHFIDRAAAKLEGIATIDKKKIVVAGHSGGACNVNGGVATAMKAKLGVLGGFAIDGCMLPDMAAELGTTRKDINLVVTWQEQSWANRSFTEFQTGFTRAVKKNPASNGVLRELDFERVTEGMPHDAMVKITIAKWLPRLLPAQSK